MAQGHGLKNVDIVVVGDDVSVTRSKGNMVGRRCLAGVVLGTSPSQVRIYLIKYLSLQDPWCRFGN